MRSLNLIMLIIILALLLVFIWQNFYTVTISFFKWNMTLPQAIIIAGFYVQGKYILYTDDDEREEENRGKHTIFSFFNAIRTLKEGTYIFNQSTERWEYVGDVK